VPDIRQFLTDDYATWEAERAITISQLWQAYNGDHIQPVEVTPGREGRSPVDDNVIANMCGNVVDKGVSFLFGKDLEMSLAERSDQPQAADPQADQADPDEEWLKGIWKDNKQMTLLQDAAQNGGVTGHLFIKTVETGDPDRPIKLVNLDPSTVTAFWNPDDVEDLWGYKIEYITLFNGRDAVRRQLIEKDDSGLWWNITNEVSYSGSKVWQPYETVDIPAESRWLFDFPPVIDCKNLPRPNEYYGKSDLEGGPMQLNDSLNRSLTSMQRILRHFGHPRPWTSGVQADQIQVVVTGPDRIITLPKDATLNQLEMSGDLAASIEYYRALKQVFNEVAKNPQVDPEKLGSVGGLAGVALVILYQPLLEKNETKRRLYGDMLVELNRRLLEIGGKTPRETEIGWQDPLPIDLKELAETLTLLKALGLSAETALEKAGFDPQVEEQRRESDPTPSLPELATNPVDPQLLLDTSGANGGGGA
jgi:hypothetical protein